MYVSLRLHNYLLPPHTRLPPPPPHTPSLPPPHTHTVIQVVVVPVHRGEGAVVHVAKTVSTIGASCLCAARDDLVAVNTREEENVTMKSR